MASIKEDFYRLIGNDYYERQEKSFVYLYVKREKESHFKIQLRRHTSLLLDVKENRLKLACFLLESADKDVLLQKHIKKLIKLPDMLDNIFDSSDAGEIEGTIRDRLDAALKLIKKNLVYDVDTELMYKLASEMEAIYTFDKERKDIYVEITESFLRYEQGEQSSIDYLNFIIELVLSKSKMSIGKNAKRALAEYGRAISDDGIFDKLVSEKDIMTKLVEVLNEKKNSVVPYDILKSMTEEMQDKILKRDVATLLYDAGYSGDEDKNVRTRKKDRSMDMLDAYCRKNSITLFAGERAKASSTQESDEQEYYKACDKLLALLNEEKRNDVFVPLMIDEITGASIYIIGKRYYPSNLNIANKSCVYGYVKFNGVDIDTSMAYEIDINNYDMPSMEEAVLWLDKNVRAETIEAYQDYNSVMPTGCPVLFRSFFDRTDMYEDEYDEFDDIKNELDIEYEEYKEKLSRMKNNRKNNE